MKKVLLALLLATLSLGASAQPGPGPGPTPGPWVQNGSAVSPAQSTMAITVPSTVTGGSQGAGTINASALYINGVSVPSIAGSVASFSAGTTGLTPATATTGAITLGGVLVPANGGTGITSLGAGVATWLGTPSSANLRAAVTDETGGGSLVFADAPTLSGIVKNNGSSTTSGFQVGSNQASPTQWYWRGANNSAIYNTASTNNTLSVMSDVAATENRMDLRITSSAMDIFSNWTTGSGVPFRFGAGTTQWSVATTGNISAIAGSGDIAPTTLTATSHINAGASANIRWTGRGVLQSPSTTQIDMLNSTGSSGADVTMSRLALGTSSFAGYNIRNSTALSGATDSTSIYTDTTIQSGVTAAAQGFGTNLQTQAAAFTLPTLMHYRASQGTIGAGSTVTNQYGYYAHTTLTGATNNYGFYGALAASGTSRYNIYMAGSAPNFMQGALGIGTATLTGYNLRVGANLTGATTAGQISAETNVQSDVTGSAFGHNSQMGTQAASFTLGSLMHYRATQGTFGAGSTVTNQYGVYVDSTLTGATNNYGVFSNIASGANRWNIYAGGTASNWFAGPVHAGNTILLYGASSGTTTLAANGVAAGTITVPNGTDVLVARNTTDTLTNKTLTAPAINGGTINNTTTGVTQSPGTNNTTMATTAYVDAAVTASGGVPVASTLPYAGVSAPSGYLFANGQAVSRSTYSGLFAALTASSTVTITIASPGVVTWNSHGLSAGAPVVFSTTGALPTGLVAGTTYYVRDEAVNTFQVSATPGGASINTTGSQSGVQTARYVPFGNGDGSTTFNVPDLRGRVAFGVDNMGGVSFASRLGLNSSVGGFSGLATLGIAGGAQTHVQTAAELAPHTHAVPGGMVGGIDVSGAGGPYLSATFTNNGTSGSQGSGSAMNITPPAQVMNYIIKY